MPDAVQQKTVSAEGGNSSGSSNRGAFSVFLRSDVPQLTGCDPPTFGRNIWQKFTRGAPNNDKWIKYHGSIRLLPNIVFSGVNEVSIRRQCGVNEASIFVNDLVQNPNARLSVRHRKKLKICKFQDEAALRTNRFLIQ